MNQQNTSSYDDDDIEAQELRDAEATAVTAKGASPNGTAAAAPSWGFETKPKKLTKEVVLGFAAIAILVSVFGAVVMKKFNGDGEKFVETPATETDAEKAAKAAANEKDPFNESNGLATSDSSLAQNDGSRSGELFQLPDDTQDSIFEQQGEPGTRNTGSSSAAQQNQMFVDRQNGSSRNASTTQTAGLFQGPANSANNNQLIDSEPLMSRDQLAEPDFGSGNSSTGSGRSQVFAGSLPSAGDDESPFGQASVPRPIAQPSRLIGDSLETSGQGRPFGQASADRSDPFANQQGGSQILMDPSELGDASAPGNATLADDPRGDFASLTLGSNSLDRSQTFANDRSPFQSQSASRSMVASPAGTYIIQDGDSFWNISEKVYGTGKHFQALADYNRHLVKNPNALKLNTTILTPDIATLTGRPETLAVAGGVAKGGGSNFMFEDETTLASNTQSASNSEIGTTVRKAEPTAEGIFFNDQGHPMYRIGPNDSLNSIAAEHLGRSSRWRQIYQMNRDQLDDPNKLKLKMIIRLPADASTSPLISRSSDLR